MRLRRLRIERLRLIDSAELDFGPGLHWLVGPNGSGKSSALEAVSLLASGRSFRGGSPDGCIQRGAESLTVFAEVERPGSGPGRVGLTRVLRGGFEARVDGQRADVLSELFQAFPAVVFPADTGELISGPGELRRRFLDWGLFHVEQDFYPAWRRYARALRQRNLLLRQRGSASVEQAWLEELAREGELIHGYRERYLSSLDARLSEVASWLLPGLGRPRLRHRPGWPADRGSFHEALLRQQDTDRRMGFTGIGPHRAGWSLGFESLPQRELFSRGQAKLASLLMLLVQVADFSAQRGEPPVLGLDDALAELDPDNQARLVHYLRQHQVQALLATADHSVLERHVDEASDVFHVEQGRLHRQL
ncbi:DNA replication/repair protein RecF [Pseudomarimonas salicorniae]|uniref:DNA replication and repair protein RecF n=1 Tax=Pseudomarimonas salicorniae TaxID=2933270 RepID=A0ABT0GD43_9GAMM|nr:DNA replication/repair protein RecF [Lysobacter sp. CAU 1642]MCK7592450.1 DNA replication/repair protein RecF [Lysobacter sp. CAU 1642]